MMYRRRWEVDLLSRELTVTASDENIFAMLTDADYDYGNHVLVHFGRFFSNRIVARDRLHRKSLDRSPDR